MTYPSSAQRTSSNHTITELARCVGCLWTRSGWFKERERERGGEERERGGEVGRRERGREGVGSYFTDQRGVRGTVRECVCLWRV